MSLRGYCRTLIVFIACKPAMRMTKLTTMREHRPADEKIGERFHRA